MGKQLRKPATGKSKIPEETIQKQLGEKLETLLHGTSIEDHINPLLGMQGALKVPIDVCIFCILTHSSMPSDLDIHKDTPTEILYTILLGVVKYFWGQTVYLLESSKFTNTFQARLQTIDADGLNAPNLNADYIVRYSGSLIGKHFKSLAQVCF